MSRLQHGLDLVDCARIERMLRDHGERFIARVFTTRERDYCLASRTPAVRLSGRFAAKEAILKLLGTGWRGGIAWTDMEVLPDELGRPCVTLTGGCAARARELGIEEISVSITHVGQFAAASAIGLSDVPPQ